MGYIYKIINNINDKIYVGKTELIDPNKRWKEHLHDYKTRRCENRPLYAAMNKYGDEYFSFEIIEETDTPEETCEREQYWINKLRTYIGFEDCNGYNATLGGDGKPYLNIDEDEVIKYHIEEANYILSRTAKYFNVDNQTIKKILVKNNISYLSRIDTYYMDMYEEYGGILQIDVKSKTIINIFITTPEANIYIGQKKRSHRITDACNNNPSHYAYGYLWYYGRDLAQAIDNNEIINF